MAEPIADVLSRCDDVLDRLRDIDPTAPWVLAGSPTVESVAFRIKRWLDDLAAAAAWLDAPDPPPAPPDRLYGPGISRQRGMALAIGYVRSLRRWAASRSPQPKPPQGTGIEPPARRASSEGLPPEGARFGHDDAPAAFREGGRPDGSVLTAPYLERSPNWMLRGPYLSKHYGPGRELTTHIKVGRAKAYLYAELLVLRDRKTANTADREEEGR